MIMQTVVGWQKWCRTTPRPFRTMDLALRARSGDVLLTAVVRGLSPFHPHSQEYTVQCFAARLQVRLASMGQKDYSKGRPSSGILPMPLPLAATLTSSRTPPALRALTCSRNNCRTSLSFQRAGTGR